MNKHLPLIFALLICPKASVAQPPASNTPDQCELKIARQYQISAPFTGRNLLEKMQKHGLSQKAHVMKLTYESANHKDRIELDWSDEINAFKVSRIAGARQLPLAVHSPQEIQGHEGDLAIVFRYTTFKDSNSQLVHVYDNSSKITRLVTKNFSCEFTDFFGCACMN